jgi:hypothetical protein
MVTTGPVMKPILVFKPRVGNNFHGTHGLKIFVSQRTGGDVQPPKSPAYLSM